GCEWKLRSKRIFQRVEDLWRCEET
ncbi:unnamed protein product, partial [Allacma fusca]